MQTKGVKNERIIYLVRDLGIETLLYVTLGNVLNICHTNKLRFTMLNTIFKL